MSAENMSTEGLYDACLTHAVAMRDSNDFAQRVEAKRWLFRYLAELQRRALRAEHDLTMLRMSQRHAS